MCTRQLRSKRLIVAALSLTLSLRVSRLCRRPPRCSLRLAEREAGGVPISAGIAENRCCQLVVRKELADLLVLLLPGVCFDAVGYPAESPFDQKHRSLIVEVAHSVVALPCSLNEFAQGVQPPTEAAIALGLHLVAAAAVLSLVVRTQPNERREERGEESQSSDEEEEELSDGDEAYSSSSDEEVPVVSVCF